MLERIEAASRCPRNKFLGPQLAVRQVAAAIAEQSVITVCCNPKVFSYAVSLELRAYKLAFTQPTGLKNFVVSFTIGEFAVEESAAFYQEIAEITSPKCYAAELALLHIRIVKGAVFKQRCDDGVVCERTRIEFRVLKTTRADRIVFEIATGEIYVLC
jgi:hypothetical protein